MYLQDTTSILNTRCTGLKWFEHFYNSKIKCNSSYPHKIFCSIGKSKPVKDSTTKSQELKIGFLWEKILYESEMNSGWNCKEQTREQISKMTKQDVPGMYACVVKFISNIVCAKS